MERYILKSGIEGNGFTGDFLSDSHRYVSSKGEISMLLPCYASRHRYEIYCIDGGLFEDIERYETLGEAEGRIKELLD